MGSQDARAGPRRPGIGLRVFTALVVAGLLASALPPVTGVTAHVVINEVLYDPPPGGHEWVELYNNESVGVSVDGWILTDEDDNDFVIPDIPDMPSGARIVVHFLLNGPNETAFGESEPGVLHLSAPFENVLDPVDQLALYSGPKSPSTIEDYVEWATGGPVAACTPTSLVSRAGEQYSDLNVDLAGFNNRLHAVWSSADPVAGSDSDWDIVGRDFGAPGWSPFDELNTPGVPDSRYGSPVLAAHAAGLYAFWETPRGGFPDVSDLNYSVHDGARWSDEQSVESGPANVTHAAPTAASFSGDLFVVWERTETATSRADDVVYKRLSGGNWSSLEYVSNAGDNSTDSNPVAGVFGGVLYVFWARADYSVQNSSAIVYRAFNGVTWGPILTAVSQAENIDLNQLVRIDFVEYAGALHLVWSAYGLGGTGPEIFYRTFDATSWGPITALATGVPGTASYVTDPALAATAGALYVVWTHTFSIPQFGFSSILLRTLTADGWSDASVLTDAGVDASDPAIAVVGSAVYVAWEQYSDGTGDADVAFCRLQASPAFGDDENAVVAGVWAAGTFVDTTGMAQNLTLYRVLDGGDTDDPGDWAFADYRAPVAVPQVTSPVLEDRPVSFSGSDSSDNIGIVRYLWDINAADPLDWATPDALGRDATWVYATPGNYTATLRVEDAAGNADMAQIAVTVLDDAFNDPPYNVTLNVTPTSIFRRATTALTGTGQDSPTPTNLMVHLEWRARNGLAWSTTFFGNVSWPGNYYSAPFTPDGSAPIDAYSLRVRLSDANGSYSAWTTLVNALTVLSDLPIADAGADQVVPEATALFLDGSRSSDNPPSPLLYTWDFGDGITSPPMTNSATFHVWSRPGVYTVRLTVTDQHGNQDDDVALVTVLDTTDPTARIAGPFVIDEDQGARFDASGSTDNVGVVRFSWSFGDGAEENGTSPLAVHAYDIPGNYTVNLTIFDAAGNPNKSSHPIQVLDLITVNDDPRCFCPADEDFQRIQDAINSPNTTAGERIYVHAGTYREAVRVNKSVLLQGASQGLVFVEPPAGGTGFNVTADRVQIDGLTVRSQGTCVFLAGVDRFNLTYSSLEDCDIALYAQSTTNSYIAHNRLLRGRYGLVADRVLDDAYRWNEIAFFTGFGAKSYDAELVNCFNWNQFHHNQVAYFYDPSHNLTPLEFDGNELWENGVGLRVQDADTILVSRNTFRDNLVAVELLNASPEIFSNTFVGVGDALRCARSGSYVHDNDFTAMPVVRVACTATAGLRFENNYLGSAEMHFTDGAVASLDIPAGKATFVNSSTDPDNVRLLDTATATYGWRLVVLVLDRHGDPVEGADVYVVDAFNTTVASAVTGTDGRTPPMLLVGLAQFAPTRGGVVRQGPFAVTATMGLHAGSAILDLTGDVELSVTLPTFPPITTPEIEPPPFPGLAVIAIASLLFAAGIGTGGLSTTEVGKWSLWMFILPLYTRLRKEDIVEQPTRSKILGFILGSPGSHFALIGQRLSLAHGQLAYHLDVLTKEGLIFARSDGFKKRFYPADTPPEVAADFVLSDIQERVVEVIAVNPGIGQKALSAALNASRQVVSYHVEKLLKFGKVRKVGDGRNAQYYLVDEGRGWVSTIPANGQA